jgi:hypothetical protein
LRKSPFSTEARQKTEALKALLAYATAEGHRKLKSWPAHIEVGSAGCRLVLKPDLEFSKTSCDHAVLLVANCDSDGLTPAEFSVVASCEAQE